MKTMQSQSNKKWEIASFAYLHAKEKVACYTKAIPQYRDTCFCFWQFHQAAWRKGKSNVLDQSKYFETD